MAAKVYDIGARLATAPLTKAELVRQTHDADRKSFHRQFPDDAQI